MPTQIDIWYGTTQNFGAIGTPQRWVNILGNVSDPGGVVSLYYSLNDGSDIALSIGANIYRLANSGDFNIEIDTDIDADNNTLRVGSNTLVITAVNSLGDSTEQTVTVNYHNDSEWPTTSSIDWASVGNIQNVAQIVDGKWVLSLSGVSPVEPGYDRLIAIGEINWTNYEITVPLTVRSIDPAGYASPSNGPGVGILMGWLGHNDDNVQRTQPKRGWRPIGALGWYRWRSETNERLNLLGIEGGTLQRNTSLRLQFGQPYMMKMRVKSNAGQGNTYSLKWWEAGQSESAEWDLQGTGQLTSPQEGSLMLVAHHADVEFGNLSIKPVSTVGAIIGSINEEAGTTTATITWTTDEPTTANIQYGEDATYGSSTGSPGFNIHHSLTISGLLPAQTVHYAITVVDTDGNITTSAGRSFLTKTNNPPVQGSLSDNFDSTPLNTGKWTFVDPVGDSLVSINDGQLALSVSGGVVHDVWTGDNNTARITQALPDEDFFVEIKFDSTPSQRYQIQGLLIEQDNGRFIRFDFSSNGSNLQIFAASFQNGTPTVQIRDIIASESPLYMRVRRISDQWTQEYSRDGADWKTADSFTYNLTVNSASLFSGNAGGNAPAYTTLVDYYWIDQDIPVDTSAPRIRNVQVAVSANEATITWATDEPANSSLAYGLTTAYDIGSIDNAAMVTSHSAILSGLTTDTQYHFQITVTDASDNAYSSEGQTLTPIVDENPPIISDIQTGNITLSEATISWATDEPATSSIEYGTDPTYGSVVNNASLSLTHRLSLTGFLPGQTVYYRITSVDASGNGTVSADRSLITSEGNGPVPGALSDEFTEGTLNLTQWIFIDPVGDSSVNVNNGQLALSVGGGISHNVWIVGNNSARVTHTAADQNFFAEIKFDTIPTQRYQLQGLLVEQNETDFVRFDFYSDGNNLKIFAATFQAGQPTIRVNATIANGGPLYMRVRRVDDQWAQEYSYDGVDWQTAVTFAHTLSVTSTSLFAGNAGENVPAYTALVDYYRTDAQ